VSGHLRGRRIGQDEGPRLACKGELLALMKDVSILMSFLHFIQERKRKFKGRREV
jgi:hypothetical protein